MRAAVSSVILIRRAGIQGKLLLYLPSISYFMPGIFFSTVYISIFSDFLFYYASDR